VGSGGGDYSTTTLFAHDAAVKEGTLLLELLLDDIDGHNVVIVVVVLGVLQVDPLHQLQLHVSGTDQEPKGISVTKGCLVNVLDGCFKFRVIGRSSNRHLVVMEAPPPHTQEDDQQTSRDNSDGHRESNWNRCRCNDRGSEGKPLCQELEVAGRILDLEDLSVDHLGQLGVLVGWVVTIGASRAIDVRCYLRHADSRRWEIEAVALRIVDHSRWKCSEVGGNVERRQVLDLILVERDVIEHGNGLAHPNSIVASTISTKDCHLNFCVLLIVVTTVASQEATGVRCAEWGPCWGAHREIAQEPSSR